MVDSVRNRLTKLSLFALWLAVVLFTAWHHAVWRDEVRALSIATSTGSPAALLQALRIEGHPSVWYLVLKVVHLMLPVPLALRVAALLVAAAAALLLVLRSPFRWPVVGLLLFGYGLLFEYPVMARNYGISLLLLFLLAAFYREHRSHGMLLGVLLFLLPNCNAHSVLLTGGFLGFWLIDVIAADALDRPRLFRVFLGNAALAILGIAICAYTIYPPVQDAVYHPTPPGSSLFRVLKAVLLPAASFEQTAWLVPSSIFPNPRHVIVAMEGLLSVILFGSTLGLLRRPGAFLAALGTLFAFSVFFSFVYPGSYRHEGLWLGFLTAMYWIARSDSRQMQLPARWQGFLGPVPKAGWICFLVLIGLQAGLGIRHLAPATDPAIPFSRSRELGELIRSRPELKDAILIADPDFVLEAVPYYLPNPTYLMREHRFGQVVYFTKKAQMELSLDQILENARRLHGLRNQPVVILLHLPLEPAAPARQIPEAYIWTLATSPEQVRNFQASTEKIGHFGPAVTDESYDVYVLK